MTARRYISYQLISVHAQAQGIAPRSSASGNMPSTRVTTQSGRPRSSSTRCCTRLRSSAGEFALGQSFRLFHAPHKVTELPAQRLEYISHERDLSKTLSTVFPRNRERIATPMRSLFTGIEYIGRQPRDVSETPESIFENLTGLLTRESAWSSGSVMVPNTARGTDGPQQGGYDHDTCRAFSQTCE